jgi:hypothetical protein
MRSLVRSDRSASGLLHHTPTGVPPSAAQYELFPAHWLATSSTRAVAGRTIVARRFCGGEVGGVLVLPPEAHPPAAPATAAAAAANNHEQRISAAARLSVRTSSLPGSSSSGACSGRSPSLLWCPCPCLSLLAGRRAGAPATAAALVTMLRPSSRLPPAVQAPQRDFSFLRAGRRGMGGQARRRATMIVMAVLDQTVDSPFPPTPELQKSLNDQDLQSRH